jgi:protein SCO1/2
MSCSPTAGDAGHVVREGVGLPFYSTTDLTPQWPGNELVNSPAFHRIRPFRFTNQNGRSVTEESFDGKITVINFFFASCGGICPRMTENLGVVQREFLEDEDVRLVSHSVTPE